jgi:hypothetical protein
MVLFKRVLLSLFIAFLTFFVVFLAIFVPLLFRDMHYAPHDGQGGLGGFVLGVPIASIAAFAIGIFFLNYSKTHRWFEHRNLIIHSDSRPDSRSSVAASEDEEPGG